MAFKHNLDNEVLNAKRNKMVFVEILNIYPNDYLYVIIFDVAQT